MIIHSFPDLSVENTAFAIAYIENFLRYYIAFYTKDRSIIQHTLAGEQLKETAQKRRTAFPYPDSIGWVFSTLEQIRKGEVPIPQGLALQIPRKVSDIDDTTTVMFLDEFQNIHLPQYQFDIVGLMQEAVESPTCPHFVTGSAMSILERDIIGRGALYGRFRGHRIGPMSEYWGAELAL